MGSHLNRNQSTVQFDKYHGGWCIWGLLPLHLKKLMPHTRGKHERHSKYGLKRCPRESNNDQDHEARNTNSSCNALVCIRENISPHTSKDGDLGEGKVIAEPRLMRACAVHHLEPSKYLDENIDLKLSDSEKIALETCHWTARDVSDHEYVDEYKFSDEFPSRTYNDFFDAFKIDRKLFLNITRKSDAHECERVAESRKKVTLRRSGSYPTANKSCNRYGNLTPSKLDDKLIEVWPSGSSSSTASPFSSSSPSSSTTSSSSSSSHQSDNIKILRSHSMLCKLPMDGVGEVSYRRTSPLNKSMEIYTQLLETSRNAKLNPSSSLKLSNEDEVDHRVSDLTMLQNVHSVNDALQVDHSCSIELPKVPTKSATQRTESYVHEASDLEVTEDEPGPSDRQNAAHTILEDFPQENILRTKDTIDLTDLANTLKQLLDFGTTQDQTELYDDLDDLLLSDLVTELLYDVYAECDAYYWPTSLCPKCHVDPQPLAEDHVNRKVLKRIKKIQDCILQASNIVECVTAYDLANSYGRMNLQIDAESLGLALEEILFDELIQELVYE